VTATAAGWIEQAVDTERYPLSAPTSTDWKKAISAARQELDCSGCTVLPGFIRSSMVEALRLECSSVVSSAYYDVETVNVYNTAADVSLPEGHPLNTMMERGNAFVPRDTIPEEFLIQQLYASQQLQHLVASCFHLSRVYELADPLAGLCLNVLTPGRSHPWHFDTNQFAVSLITQGPEAGGSFDYCPNIRSANTENFDDVGQVLAGRGEHLIRSLWLRPGDLQLFRGRYSMHRVSAVQGGTERHSAIFAYAERPGVVGTVARTRQLFGRVLPAHLAAGDLAVRADQLLD